METPKKQLQTPCEKTGDDHVATTSSPKAMDSPKTPVRTLDSSFDDEDTDDMESPQFPHLIPVYHSRTPDEYDLEGERIGWDDGYGSVFYRDDDYIVERNGKRIKRNRRNRLFSERHHRSFFGSHKYSQNTNSPSPDSSTKNAAIQAELNDYLGCILNCLSGLKRKRQLMKSKSDEKSTNNSVENNVSRLLDDSADDEMMLLCSQAIEKTIAADANCDISSKTTDYLSIPGISPLEDTDDTINNNVYHHAAKKFKSIQSSNYLDDKKNYNLKPKCHTITSNSFNNSTSSTIVTNNIKEDSSLNDSLANDDEWFSSIDLSAIEQDILLNDNKTTSVSITQKIDKVCNKQSLNTNIDKHLNNRSNLCTSTSTSTITSNSNSVLWRRCTSSSSIVKPHLQPEKPDQKSWGSINETNSKIKNNTETKPTITRFCTPAEIEAKRDRARRTLMLKFKSKNKSAM